MTSPTDTILRIAVSLQRSTLVYSFSVLACITFLAPTISFAKTYRCDGFVQTRPCGQAFTTDKNHRERTAISSVGVKRSIRAQMKRDSSASILKARFTRVSKGLGKWYGRIKGQGLVHLHLKIVQPGAKVVTRYIGNVLLTKDDRDISFSFLSSLPKGNKWKWQVVSSSQAKN